ncbi:MAG: SDR family oxidoreductase [Parvibaculum sp.]
MTNTEILVTGATGNVGSEIARQLLQKKIPFRAFTRDAAKLTSMIGEKGYDLAKGDFSDAASFRTALKGITKLFLVTNQSDAFLHDLDRLLADMKTAGVKQLVLISAECDIDSEIFFVRRTAEIEALVRASSIAFTIMRPDWFMQNFIGFAAMGLIAFVDGPGKTSFVDVRDVAEIAVKALTEDSHQGRTYRLTGPDPMTFKRAAERISKALGREIPFMALTPDQLREGMIASGAEPWYADMNAEMTFGIRGGFTFNPANDFEFLTGRKTRSLETFVADHKAAFGA